MALTSRTARELSSSWIPVRSWIPIRLTSMGVAQDLDQDEDRPRAAVVALVALLGVTWLASACAHVAATPAPPSPKHLDHATRFAALQRAQVWTPTTVPSMDIKAGPEGGFAPGATLVCDYVDRRLGGSSPKFLCSVEGQDALKVKYGRDNPEVYAEVAASRLLWALGFGADREYPVRVVCRGCPKSLQGTGSLGNETVFEVAAVERLMKGRELESAGVRGWAWPELDMVRASEGGAPVEQRDALKLLAVFLQHTDSKPEQQRLVCVSERTEAGGERTCLRTFMLISDLGKTFGRASATNRDGVSGVNLKEWARTPVWADSTDCVGNLPRSITGTLDLPRISEEGRRFLAGLLTQLTDRQLHDLFEVARFPLRTPTRDGASEDAAIQAWVDAFKEKVGQIVSRRCSWADPLHANAIADRQIR